MQQFRQVNRWTLTCGQTHSGASDFNRQSSTQWCLWLEHAVKHTVVPLTLTDSQAHSGASDFNRQSSTQ